MLFPRESRWQRIVSQSVREWNAERSVGLLSGHVTVFLLHAKHALHGMPVRAADSGATGA
jgi:hypothetical protein